MKELYDWTKPAFTGLLAMRPALPHALLLIGPPGIGKSALADRFAQALLCEAPRPDGDACGQCAACGWFEQGNHPDFRLLAPGSDEEGEGKEKDKPSREIRIAQVRGLAEFLSVGGHRAGRKVVIVDPAQAMNVPAANALLKTLEEPPGQTVFLLVTSRADALPATIRSRCVCVQLHLPSPEQAIGWLQAQPGIDAGEAAGLLAAAGGAPLRARGLAEPAQAAAYRLIIQTVARLPDNSSIQAAEAVASVPAKAWLPLLQAWVTDLGRVAAGAQPRRFPEHRDRLARLAGATSLARLTEYAQWLQRQTGVTEHPLNPRLFCEDTLSRYRQLFG